MSSLQTCTMFRTLGALLISAFACTPQATRAGEKEQLTMANVLKSSKPSDWRRLEPNNTIYMQLESGRVVIELAPAFSPQHVANIRTMVKAKYFDGLAILRSQENYVVQWGDPKAGETGAKSLGAAKSKLKGELYRSAKGLAFTALASRDAYADEIGFSGGLPVGRDSPTGRAWLAHCYAMVGAGRDMGADSGNGAELYVVIGHAPRHLDRNVTLVGRVVEGMQHLSTLPRGTGDLGFYEKPEQRVAIKSIRLAADVPLKERAALEVMRTDTTTFKKLIEARRTRREDWFVDSVGRIGLCNVPLPVRPIKPSG